MVERWRAEVNVEKSVRWESLVQGKVKHEKQFEMRRGREQLR